MTPILAAGFTNVAQTYGVTTARVSLSTGLYMMGLGVGSVIASPTAILFGKRPVYLIGAIMFILTAIWCALSPSYVSLLLARIFQGIAVSPVECLPSATIAEIFFLHERAYRIGIYTLLLLGGKNLVPLVSAAVIQSLGWRWVFWIVAMIGGFCWCLLFLFVPETFWDRTPRPKSQTRSRSASRMSIFKHRKDSHAPVSKHGTAKPADGTSDVVDANLASPTRPSIARISSSFHRPTHGLHVGFAQDEPQPNDDENADNAHLSPEAVALASPAAAHFVDTQHLSVPSTPAHGHAHTVSGATQEDEDIVDVVQSAPPTPGLERTRSPFDNDVEKISSEDRGRGRDRSPFAVPGRPPLVRYTTGLKQAPRQTFIQQLKPYNGRLHRDNWFRVAARPFVLYSYPAVLWSSVVYACSVGWLIVLSESVAVIYRDRATYNFSALSAGLIYISPFVGGVLGTAVAGKVSDIIVRAMAKRNGGLYEPEFRLVMAVPVALSTVIGLMGFGWSAQVRDAWIVPTIFFGVISFGCSLGSTTAITFCVDSYRQYAGEALVTLNFSKNILHGLVFSLFFTSWLESDGSKMVFIYIGVIQLILMAFTVPMYIFGKRARMLTVRLNLMEKF